MILNELKDKKIFITGHTGFKGSWLTLILEYIGAIVCGYSRDYDDNALYSLTHPNIHKSIEGDILNYELLEKSIIDFEPEYIIHLASQAYVDKSLIDPIETFETNVIGLTNLLKVIDKYNKVKSVLIVTSDKCYKNIETEKPYGEYSELGAQDPYSTSKACQELITDCFRFSYFNKKEIIIPISTVRASNVIGGGDFNKNRLVPYLLDNFIKGERPTIRNPYSIRPWQNVLDVLGGYLCLLVKTGQDISLAGAYNFGPEDDGFKTVENLANELSHYFCNIGFNIQASKISNFETKILKLDSTKSKKMLGWKPVYTFNETVCNVSEFIKQIHNNKDIKDICINQIDDYIRKSKMLWE